MLSALGKIIEIPVITHFTFYELHIVFTNLSLWALVEPNSLQFTSKDSVTFSEMLNLEN